MGSDQEGRQSQEGEGGGRVCKGLGWRLGVWNSTPVLVRVLCSHSERTSCPSCRWLSKHTNIDGCVWLHIFSPEAVKCQANNL